VPARSQRVATSVLEFSPGAASLYELVCKPVSPMRSTVMSSGLMGYPHLEGIDYEGEWCPDPARCSNGPYGGTSASSEHDLRARMPGKSLVRSG